MNDFIKITQLEPIDTEPLNDKDLFIISHIIESGTEYNSNSVSATQIKDYVMESVIDHLSSNGYVKGDQFATPEALQQLATMLDSMVSEANLIMYVDQTSGCDFVKDSSGRYILDSDKKRQENTGKDKNNPLKTIYQAVRNANKRKFIGNSQCYIRILSDIKLTPGKIKDDGSIISSDTGTIQGEIYEDNRGVATIKEIKIYHPDLVQDRSCFITGWDATSGTSGAKTLRTIEYNSRAYTDLYSQIMTVKCKCTIDNLKFNGGLTKYDFTELCDLDKSTIKSSYAIEGQDATVQNCQFEGCYCGVVNGNYVEDCTFNYCYNAIYTNFRYCTRVRSGIQITNCHCSLQPDGGTIEYTTQTDEPVILKSTYIGYVSGGGNLTIQFTGGTFLDKNYWANKDEKILESATTPNTGHENAYLKIQRITGRDGSGNFTYSDLYDILNDPSKTDHRTQFNLYIFDQASNATQFFKEVSVCKCSTSIQSIKKLINYGHTK